MNDKFFDLKKEKQDRMINASLKVFAENGYKRASTDDIVKEAGISKGLLFHYFETKLGLYEFLFDYCTRYMKLETSSLQLSKEKDYFVIYQQLLYAHLQLMKNYPFIHLFLTKSVSEKSTEISVDLMNKIHDYDEYNTSFFDRIKVTLFNERCDIPKIKKIMDYTVEGAMEEQIREGIFTPEEYFTEMVTYLNMMRALCYK